MLLPRKGSLSKRVQQSYIIQLERQFSHYVKTFFNNEESLSHAFLLFESFYFYCSHLFVNIRHSLVYLYLLVSSCYENV